MKAQKCIDYGHLYLTNDNNFHKYCPTCGSEFYDELVEIIDFEYELITNNKNLMT